MKMSKLFYKTLLIIVILFGVIASATSVLSGWYLYRHLTTQYRSKGTALAKSIADSTVETLLNSDAATIQATIDQFLEIEGISYVFVVDAHGEIIAHTFVPRIPAELLQIQANKHETSIQDIHINDVGDFIDVSAPVLVGVAGYVHIGLDKKTIRAAIRSAIIGQQFLLFSIFLVSVLSAYFLVNRVSQPLNQLIVHVKRLATHDFSTPVSNQAEIAQLAQNSKDEIGELAASFLSMERALQQSIENLKTTTAAKERIESELQIARDIQMSLLPRIFPPFPKHSEFDLYATIEPAREVGGDFYDFFLIDDDRLCFTIGDVSGKGVPASLFMAITKTLWRVAANKHAQPDKALADLNKELCRDNESVMFVTVFYGILHLRTGELEYSNGGHNLPFFLSRNGKVQLLENTGGMALGVMEEVVYKAKTVALQAGEGLFLYTDGVTEAMDRAGNLFTEPRLQECLQQANGATPTEVIRRALEAVKRFATGAEQSDDITTLAIRYLRH